MRKNVTIRTTERNGICRLETHIDVYNEPLDWQKRGLSYTATGYGGKIPSEWVTYIENRRYRIYVMIYGNSGSPYIIYRGKDTLINECEITRHYNKA